MGGRRGPTKSRHEVRDRAGPFRAASVAGRSNFSVPNRANGNERLVSARLCSVLAARAQLLAPALREAEEGRRGAVTRLGAGPLAAGAVAGDGDFGELNRAKVTRSLREYVGGSLVSRGEVLSPCFVLFERPQRQGETQSRDAGLAAAMARPSHFGAPNSAEGHPCGFCLREATSKLSGQSRRARPPILVLFRRLQRAPEEKGQV